MALPLAGIVLTAIGPRPVGHVQRAVKRPIANNRHLPMRFFSAHRTLLRFAFPGAPRQNGAPRSVKTTMKPNEIVVK